MTPRLTQLVAEWLADPRGPAWPYRDAVEEAICADPEHDILDELPQELSTLIWEDLRQIYGMAAGDGDLLYLESCCAISAEEWAREKAIRDEHHRRHVVPVLRAWVRRRERDFLWRLHRGRTT